MRDMRGLQGVLARSGADGRVGAFTLCARGGVRRAVIIQLPPPFPERLKRSGSSSGIRHKNSRSVRLSAVLQYAEPRHGIFRWTPDLLLLTLPSCGKEVAADNGSQVMKDIDFIEQIDRIVRTSASSPR
ncbi:hypothetical protein [Methylobacterium frigidaeris]|uniref:hypothetical protein n=1 Tax=Methylobacterium frigidaeris TaxID=2038277 RepID=UPI001EE0EE38|nr:hypothetical protein [Methylobacterium frigidaeris]